MTKTPGVESSTGSLGQGLSIGLGMALAAKLDKKDYRVYVLLGDGETDEGQVWEAAMAASHFKADNLLAIVDLNKLQIDGFTKDVMSLEPVADKWLSFGWNVIEVDGHNIRNLLEAFEAAEEIKSKPTVIIAHTIKGKGVSFMENQIQSHWMALTSKQLKTALEDLE
jgi:transketolase